MLNLLVLAVVWSVILTPLFVEHRRKRGVRADAASVVRFEAAREAMRQRESVR